MCRHFAWLGRSRSIEELVLEPPYGLVRQADRPRWQQMHVINRDGFGVGWFPAPGRTATYRRTGPIDADPEFPALAAATAGTCVLAAVRGASLGMPLEVEATAPFTDGRVLLSLNGHLNVAKTEHLLMPGYPPESTCDAALLASLLWQRLAAGEGLTDAITGLVRRIAWLDSNACLNLLATDGTVVVATTWAETLCYRVEPDGVMVASEPHDDTADWTTVADRSVVVASAHEVTVSPLEDSYAPDELETVKTKTGSRA